MTAAPRRGQCGVLIRYHCTIPYYYTVRYCTPEFLFLAGFLPWYFCYFYFYSLCCTKLAFTPVHCVIITSDRFFLFCTSFFFLNPSVLLGSLSPMRPFLTPPPPPPSRLITHYKTVSRCNGWQQGEEGERRACGWSHVPGDAGAHQGW